MSASPSQPHIALIVEGAGDHGAVPVLFRRHAYGSGVYRDLFAAPLDAKGLGNLTVEGGLEKFIAIAASRPGCKAIFVVVDADDKCVAEEVALLRARVSCRVPVEFILIEKDFEDWIYASVETLQLGEIEYQADVNGSAMIKNAMRPETYVKPVHQPKLAARIDFGLVSARNRSFRRAMDRLTTALGLVDEAS